MDALHSSRRGHFHGNLRQFGAYLARLRSNFRFPDRLPASQNRLLKKRPGLSPLLVDFEQKTVRPRIFRDRCRRLFGEGPVKTIYLVANNLFCLKIRGSHHGNSEPLVVNVKIIRLRFALSKWFTWVCPTCYDRKEYFVEPGSRQCYF